LKIDGKTVHVFVDEQLYSAWKQKAPQRLIKATEIEDTNLT